VRRLLILTLLWLAMQLVVPLGDPGHGAEWLLTFGFLILAADSVGALAATVRLPRIAGYLVTGLVFGPSVLGTVSSDAVGQLAPVSSLAIALIAFLAGAELRWKELRERGVVILKILASEMTVTLVAITTLLYAVRSHVPFLRGVDTLMALALCLLFASVTVVHSPAVTMALLSETGARGPVARTTLGVVLIADVAVILLFSGVLTLVRTVVPSPAGGGGVSHAPIVWEIFGALVVGALLGAVVAAYLRFVQRELFLFAIVVAFFGAEIARVTHVETLLTLLTAGFVAENASRPPAGEALRSAMERSAAPVFVVFFALAGASMHVSEFPVLWPLAIPIVVVRMAALWAGTQLGGRWGNASPGERRWLWMGLVSQAGVAIGLATVLAQVYPERGADMRTLFLTTIAINESLGPVLFRQALGRSGEISDADEAHAPAPRGTAESVA
jgi:Kef-type K+ transport system membrane component KefB